MNWPRIRELVRKEFIQLLRDKRNRMLLIAAPLIQMLVFGYVVNYDIRNIRVAFVDYSHTEESRSLADAFAGSPVFSITHFPEDERTMEDLLLTGQVDMGIKIAPDFAAVIRKGQTAAIQIIADGSMSNMASLRMAYTASVLDSFNRKTLRELHP